MRTILETPRLRLRELADDDIGPIAELLMDPEVMRFWPRPYTHEEAAGWIARQQSRYRDDGYGYWLAIERAGGRPIGQIGLIRQEIEGRPRLGLGYIIGRAHWGDGYATEGAAGCCDYAFGALGADEVTALIRPENEPSRAVARRLGMDETGSIQYAELTHLVYVVTREGWRRAAPPSDRR